MIDVAAVAQRLWLDVLPAAAKRALAEDFELEDGQVAVWVGFLAALHDLGKASPAFQLHLSLSKSDRALIVSHLRSAGLHLGSNPPPVPHGTITGEKLPALLTSGFAVPEEPAWRLAATIGGHHGVFPSSLDLEKVSADTAGGASWDEARLNLVTALAALLEVPRDAPPRRIGNASAMALAGLVSVADWIGSAEEYFPYYGVDLAAPSEIDPSSYAKLSAQRAIKALHQLGWTGWTPAVTPRSFAQLFPLTPQPNPLQDATVRLADQCSSPALAIIEAPMGEGKTEAAMYLADRLALRLGQRGCYFALPTQATSNQMFGRVRDFLARRYPENFVNLQLLHGHAALSAEFQTLRDRGDLMPGGIYGNDRQSTVVAAAWFTYRKRGLLAPFGVGTVDQALMAVLQTRHVFVRLFGLAHKVVIIDEVHAYDAYMTTLLERLLEWLGALGSSVVMLSATLPAARRKALAEAYARGARLALTAHDAAAYPRITWLSGDASAAEHVETSSRSVKSLTLRWVDGALPQTGQPFGLGQRLADALKDGGCAAVICNTVGRAQEVYQALKPYFPTEASDGPELDLLHSRYLFKDREEREKRARLRFGKPGARIDLGEDNSCDVARPRRAILVATQIIEQSLDLDFDLMVSDTAPVDLLLQRAGRLHRHQRDQRPAGLRSPELWLCEPVIDERGIPRFGAGTEAVYDGHILLRSWLAIRDRPSIAIPAEVEKLIEEVYGDRSCPSGLSEPIRQRWQATLDQHLAVLEHERREATERWLKRPAYSGQLWRISGRDPLEEDAPKFHRAHQALTRLADLSVQAVCVYRGPGGLFIDEAATRPFDPDAAPDPDGTRALLTGSAPISDKRIVFGLLAQPVPVGWRGSALLSHCRLLTFDRGRSEPIGKVVVRIDRELGIFITADKGA